jgi:hypothetical protein
MPPLLEIRQPLDYRRYPARGSVLQAHREQVVVYTEHPLWRGELDAGEREQCCVGLPCEERDHAGCLFEREKTADCVRARGELCAVESGVWRGDATTTYWDWVCALWRLARGTRRRTTQGERRSSSQSVMILRDTIIDLPYLGPR